ncbi:MAG: hypothetical protein PWQ41_219 [Bacillota bacterium]|nr:hypothetical protein [Bacillota bacterium]MDK2855244.1 hypothetical protein [Bacillota bacterium]MDK2924445.1 hypothetical protein [Bacillota bacterium]
MRRANQAAALCLLALAVYISVTGLVMGYYEKSAPGPGFLPFWIGVFLGLSSLGILWESRSSKDASLFPPGAFRTLFAITGAGAAAIGLSSTLGLLLALALLAGFAARFLGASWSQTAVTAVAITVTFYFLFVRFLMVSFPTGILGI